MQAQALQIYQQLNQTASSGEAPKGLGKAYLLLGDYLKAIALFQQLAE